jgi:glycerophosphoryl diester phosphodiesterase
MDKYAIAHRGYSSRYPENTMEAFRAAVDAGADIIEFDVQVSSDGRAVVIHDSTVERTAGAAGDVRAMTMNQLRGLDVSMGMLSSPARVPLLEEVLEEFSEKVELNVELKNLPFPDERMAEVVMKTIDDQDCGDSCILSSFDHFILGEIRQGYPSIRVGLLYDSRSILFRDEVLLVNPWSLHPGVDTMHPGDHIQAHSEGYRVFPWVAWRKETYERLMAEEWVDGVMINNCEWFPGTTMKETREETSHE